MYGKEIKYITSSVVFVGMSTEAQRYDKSNLRRLLGVKNLAKLLKVIQGHSKLHRWVGLSNVGLNIWLSCNVTDIFSIEYWRDLDICRVRGHSRLLEVAPFDRWHSSSYSSSTVNVAISRSLEAEIKPDTGRKTPIIYIYIL